MSDDCDLDDDVGGVGDGDDHHHLDHHCRHGDFTMLVIVIIMVPLLTIVTIAQAAMNIKELKEWCVLLLDIAAAASAIQLFHFIYAQV